jgi:hypothetical protein
VVVGGRGFLIGLSVKTAFLRVAVTAGGSVHTISGESISARQRIPVLLFGFVICVFWGKVL